MNERVRAALALLEEARETLLEFADDVWARIDHRNGEQVRVGVAFVRDYDDKVTELARLADEIEQMIQTWNGRSPATTVRESVPLEPLNESGPFGNRPPHRLSEKSDDGTFQGIKPVGFTFGNKRFPADEWVKVYVAVCQEVYQSSPERFERLVDQVAVGTRDKSPYFSRDPNRIAEPHPIADGIYARLKAGPDQLCARMRHILRRCEIPTTDVTFYLEHEPR
jgi:hypothetical protein